MPAKQLIFDESARQKILRGVEKNHATIVVTAHAKLLWALQRLSPDLTLWVAQKAMDRIRALLSGV